MATDINAQILAKAALNKANSILSTGGTISIIVDPTTITLPPGSSAYVENVGTVNKIELKFGIPSGYDGKGIVAGGSEDQVLAKQSKTDFDTKWKTLDKASVGLENVDNTPDILKIVSIAQAEAINTVELNLQAQINNIAPKVYHTNLSKSGSNYEIVIGNIIYRLEYTLSTTIALSVKSTGESFLVDIKRFGQYDVTGVEGNTVNNFTLNTTKQSLDAIIYNNSNEMHKTWIRQQDPITKLWSLHEVNLFTSANGARTDIWVYKIYENGNY